MSEITYGRSQEEMDDDLNLALFEAWESLGYAKSYVPEPNWLDASQRGCWLAEARALQKAAESLRPRDPRYWAQQREYNDKAARVRKILMAC